MDLFLTPTNQQQFHKNAVKYIIMSIILSKCHCKVATDVTARLLCERFNEVQQQLTVVL